MRPPRANGLPSGLYAIADAGYGDPVALGIALAKAGCRVIQLRAKTWDDARLEVAARALLSRLHALGALLLVNDRVGVAARVGADGVHLGQDDGPTETARLALGAGALVGRSTHDLAQVRAAQDADYLGFGPVFATATKPRAPRGTAALEAAVRASARPVVAIGGITPRNLDAVRATGVHGWAVISALLTAPDLTAAVSALSR